MKPLGFLLVVHLTSFTVAAQHSNSQGIAVKKDERVVVDCSLKADMGIYWFRQTESETPTFLFYINGVGKVTPEITGYSATKTSSKVSLTVNSFTKEDSGKYYCVTLKNMAMVFGQVKILYLKEVKSTTQPTTSKAKSTAPKNKETIPCSSTTTVLGIQEDKMSCHIFIWAPLTGAAFLLLLALIFVSIVYCRRPRRKRCQHQFQQHFSSQGHSASDLQTNI